MILMMLTPIGHLVDFFNNSDALLTRARWVFHSDTLPLSVQLLTQIQLDLFWQHEEAVANKNTNTHTNTKNNQMLLKILGACEPAIQVTHEPLPRDKEGFPNPKGLSLPDLARQMHTRQLMPREKQAPIELQLYDRI